MSAKKKLKFLIHKAIALKLYEYRLFLLGCSVSPCGYGDYYYSISIGERRGWLETFNTLSIGNDCEKINNCLCWSCGDGLFRAVYIDTFCKMGDIILYSTATGDSKDRASLDAIYAWRNAKREIIKIIDDEIDKMKC